MPAVFSFAPALLSSSSSLLSRHGMSELSEQQLLREERLRAAQPRVHLGHSRKITALAWSAGGALLATGSMDTTVRVWPLEAATGALRRAADVLRGHTATVDASVREAPPENVAATTAHAATSAPALAASTSPRRGLHIPRTSPAVKLATPTIAA